MPKMGIIMPKMGTGGQKKKSSRHGRESSKTGSDSGSVGLADALFTTTQQRVLGLLFGQPGRSFFANELIGFTGSGSGAVQRELRRLATSGLLTVTRIGNQKHFQANRDSPVFDELCSLVIKTVGLADPIRRALLPLAEKIDLALLYGSVPKGTDTASSDVDLLVVSDELMLEDPLCRCLRKQRPCLIERSIQRFTPRRNSTGAET